MVNARSPEAGGARMEPLATLPVFYKLQGRPVLLAGGDLPAVWKAELLAAAGARVRVFAEAPCPEMIALKAALPADALDLIGRPWTPDDLAGSAMALGSIEDEVEAERFVTAAHRAGAPVNVIDKPAFCDFQFGTIVARSPLVIGISTDGAAPVFGQALRARIEAIVPQGLRLWAQAARDWRPAVQERALDFRRRRRFWETFTARALASPNDVPSNEDRDACFAAVSDRAMTIGSGKVTMVGSGRGDTDSITLRSVAVLQSADIVYYDPDVSDAAIALSRREAAKSVAPIQLDSTAINALRQSISDGRHVAWLGTGNPLSCRRWQDRIDRLRGVGIKADTAPGLDVCPSCPDRCLHYKIS